MLSNLFKRVELQAIGAVLLIIAFVAMLLKVEIQIATLIMCISLTLVGLLDLYLIKIVKDATVSSWIRNKVGDKIGTYVWLIVTAIVIYLDGWFVGGVFVMGFLNNHFFAND